MKRRIVGWLAMVLCAAMTLGCVATSEEIQIDGFEVNEAVQDSLEIQLPLEELAPEIAELPEELDLDPTLSDEAVKEAPAVQKNTGDGSEDGEAVPLDESHFPDPDFRSFIDYLDEDGDGILSYAERAACETLGASWKLNEATSLKGIEWFPNLRKLYYSGENCTELDMSKNAKLQLLNLDGCSALKSVDISHNPELYYVCLTWTDVRSLDITNCPYLRALLEDEPYKYTEYETRFVRFWNQIDMNYEHRLEFPAIMKVIVDGEVVYKYEDDPSSFEISEDGTLTKYRGIGGDVVIPSTVKEIGKTAFMWCTNLTSITIPNSVTKVGSFAFQGCTDLTSVSFPGSVTVIDSYAFTECTGLQSITMQDSVTKIGISAFEGCTALTSAKLSKNVTYLEQKTFCSCTSLQSITLPGKLDIVGASAFQGCEALDSIEFPKALTSIGRYAFQGCKSLRTAILPESMSQIQSQAFADCTGLTKIRIPKGVRSWNIGDDAFDNCPNLTIYGTKGSGAEEFAREKGIPFAADEDPAEKQSIENAVITVKKQVYNGKARTPKVTVVLNDITLSRDTDYTVSYKNNTSVGIAKAIVKGIGDYTGKQQVDFIINPAAAVPKGIALDNGKLIFKWKAVTKQADGYNVQYASKANFSDAKSCTVKGAQSDNVSLPKPKPGKDLYAKVRVYKKRNGKTYRSAWSETLKYHQDNVNLADATITLKKVEYAFDGMEKRPEVIVELDGKTLDLNIDYTVTYSKNVKAGTASALVKGIGNYKGRQKCNFTIKYDLAKAAIWLTPDGTPYRKVYTGDKIKPSVLGVYVENIVTGKQVKVPKSGYTVSYSNNKNCGTSCWVKVNGKNYCMGTGRVNFTIMPGKPKNLKAKASRTEPTVTLTWKKGDVDYYQVRIGKYKDIHRAGKPKKVLANESVVKYNTNWLEWGTQYYFFVNAVKNNAEGDYICVSARTVYN